MYSFPEAMHDMWCAPRQQQNVTGAHGEALTIRKLNSARSLQHNVIGRFSQSFLFVISSPIPLKLTTQIQTAPNVGQADEFVD
ncbi:hypothetical protein PMm318_A42820 [Pseudomonas moorei]